MAVSFRPSAPPQTRQLRVSYLPVSLFLGALLVVICWLGVWLSANLSVSAAWERTVDYITADPRYQVLHSTLAEGSSAAFLQRLLIATADAAAGGEEVVLLTPTDLLNTAAAFRQVEIHRVDTAGKTIIAAFSAPWEHARELQTALEATGVYSNISLEPESDCGYLLTCTLN